MRVIIFLLGFFLLANIYVFPWMSASPRMTDVIAVIAYGWLFFRICKSGLSPVLAIFSFLFLAPFTGWAIYSFIQRDMVSFVVSIRWLLALPIAIAIVESVKIYKTRNPAIYGMWFGCTVNVLVMVLQALNFHEFVQSVGLAPFDSAVKWVYGNYRSSGMYNHPNGSFAVLSMIIPLSLYLYFINKRNIAYLLIGIIILFIGGELTYTRSPILVSFVVIIGAFVLFKKQMLATIVKLSPLFLALIAMFLIVGPPGGWERWTDADNYSNNSSERLYSSMKSFEVMVDHPIGLGVPGAKDKVREYSGIGATHNAFMILGGSFGILSAFFLFFSLVFIISQMILTRRLSIHGLICMQAFLLFFFEEHLTNPFFIIISMWLLVSVMDQIGFSPQMAKANTFSWKRVNSLKIAVASTHKDVSKF